MYIGGVFEQNVDGSGDSTGTVKYYQFGGRAVAMRTAGPGGGAGTVRYLLADHLGSTCTVTGSNGTVVASQRYWPFGATRSGSITQTDKLYTGQRQEPGDSALGLYNYKARFYGTTLGRFASVDPVAGSIGDPQGWNPYAYVRNNPLRHVDPTGMCIPDYDGPRGCGLDPYSQRAADLAACQADAVACNALAARYESARISEGVLNFLSSCDDPVECASQMLDQGGDKSDDLPWGPANAVYEALSYLGEQEIPGGGGLTVADAIILARTGGADSFLLTLEKSEKQKALLVILQDARRGVGKKIAGEGTKSVNREALRLAAKEGGSPDDWVKMTSTAFYKEGNITYQIHLFRILVTGKQVELKLRKFESAK